MRKKDKLYKVNKFNRPAFMPKENLFLNGGNANALAQADYQKNPWNYTQDYMYGNGPSITNQYLNSKNAFGISKAQNPFSKANLGIAPGGSALKGVGSAMGSVLIGGVKGMGAQIIGDTIGGIVGAVGNGVGNLLGGGKKSGVGNAVQNVTGGLGNIVGGVPIVGGLAKGALDFVGGTVGGIANALIGTKIDQEKLNAAKEGTAALNNFSSTASSLDDIKGPQAQLNVQDAYKGGVFKKGWARKRNEQLKEARTDASLLAQRGILNNAENLMADQLNDELANYSAFGGPLDMGAINYEFMTDYLISKNKKSDNNSQMTNLFAGAPSSMFAFGGDMQTNSADFPTNLTHIDAGGSHESSPYDGVQMGVDSQNVPNLVEEGETVYEDYVFSNRILADEATKQMFHLPKKKDITFADISKKLEKEIAERPNDPISKAGFKAQMQTLEEQQERQKAEMEAERARAAFEALSPEEQTAVMQNAAQQEQMAQQAAQQQAMAEEQAMQQPSTEELAMEQQQMADGSQAALGQEAPMMAEGGKLFKEGGNTKKNAGTWKKGTSKENWDKYARNGLRDFLLKVNDDIANADTEEKKNKIREDAIKTVRGIQQAYSEAYQNNLTPSEMNEKVTALQKAFQNAGGNAYFSDIADNINMPKGHNTEDTEEKGWVDGFWGPRTSIRNWGSTEYGDDYDDIRELAAEAGLTYAPGQYKYGDNTLYELGMAQPDVAAVIDTPEGDPYTEGWEERRGISTSPDEDGIDSDSSKVSPKRRAEWMRYAGLFGPAVGLGMQALGVGRPNTSGLETAARGAGNVSLADYQPIGDYLTYRPMDIWFEQNKLDAQSRATDRAILNSGANQGSKAAALLASGLNSQIASGELYRKGLEYNDALRERVAGFNRGTNQFNAESYNRNSQFNADAKNRASQAASSLLLQAAKEKLDADAGWYNSLYGNIGGIFDGLSAIGTENARHNELARMAADGLFGNLGKSYTGTGYVKEASEGGKVKKKKNKKGLTF